MKEHLALLPIILPLTGVALTLLLRRRRRIQAVAALAAIGSAFASSLVLLSFVWRQGEPIVFHSGGWPAPYGISLVGDLLSATMAVMSQAVLLMGVVYALGSRDQAVRYQAFLPLFMGLTTGLTGAMLSGDLFNLFVFAELMVISATALTAISDDPFGAEAAFKYFYISLLAAAFLLLAIGSLYVSYGTVNMADLAQRIAADPNGYLVPPAIALLIAAFMVKSAVFPFHFWQPDFHATSPTAVHAVLSSVVVKLGVYGFLRMTTLLFVTHAAVIQTLLIILGIAGVFYGGLSAIGTHDVKRMLAYSTLAQVGLILVPIGWGTPMALTAAIIMMFNHSLIKSAMLMLAGAVSSRTPTKTAAFYAITGLGKKVPAAGVLFLFGGLALAGIPPTNGFVSKMVLFRSGLEGQYYLSLAIIALASVLSLIYVARAFQRIWWQPMAENAKAKPVGDKLWAPALLITTVLALGLWAEPLVQLAQATVSWLMQPEAYIQAVLGG